MEVFGNDFLFGKNFRASDYGLYIASFSHNGESEDEISLSPTVIEEYVGHNPVPVYLGQKYESKLTPSITVVKNPYMYKGDNLHFTEKELRAILREISGIKGYHWLKLVNYDIDNDLWYRARIEKISYKRVGGNAVGIILNFICDSGFAWSEKTIIDKLLIQKNQKISIFNDTDDLNNYVYPIIKIQSNSDISGTFAITNLSDKNWVTRINGIKKGEIITIDSKNEIISSTITRTFNDFNYCFPRLVPGRNIYTSNVNIYLTFTYRTPRKVGFV